MSETLRFVRTSLDERHLCWLRSLPQTLVLEQTMLLCHGTPLTDSEYLLRQVTAAGATTRDKKAVAASIEPQFTLTLCGHDHMPAVLSLPDGRLVVNPGSVGLQAYTDDAPHPHSMQTGTPHARYALLSKRDGGWSVELQQVGYDHQTAARAARTNGRDDWAHWLLTGGAHERRPDGASVAD